MSASHDLNLSLVAGNIVSNAAQSVRHLFCPFCGDSFVFEYMLKEHLKVMHSNQLQKCSKPIDIDSTDAIGDSLRDLTVGNFGENFSCSFCGAIFLHRDLLPKHISDYHGAMYLKVWQEQQQQQQHQSNKPMNLMYAQCSPGLSELFDNISTSDTVDSIHSPLKSILKKSNTKTAAHRIICSPSSAVIRRTKNTTLVRRSSSARRELRFDFDDENETMAHRVMPQVKSTELKKRRRHGCLPKALLFGQCVSSRKKKSPRRILTSTPNNFLDVCEAGTTLIDDIDDNNRNWRGLMRGSQRSKPLFSMLERFQCAHCKSAWESNADLLTHLNEKHKNIRRWFQADYQCGTCAARFFSNRFLVRHCHVHHTPVKRLRWMFRRWKKGVYETNAKFSNFIITLVVLLIDKL